MFELLLGVEQLKGPKTPLDLVQSSHPETVPFTSTQGLTRTLLTYTTILFRLGHFIEALTALEKVLHNSLTARTALTQSCTGALGEDSA